LRLLLEIPGKFRLPIVYGYFEKQAVAELSKSHPQLPRDKSAKSQAMAFSLCAIGAERYMRESAGSSEVATLVAENNNDTRKTVKVMHSLLRGRSLQLGTIAGADIFSLLSNFAPHCLPIRRIVDSVYFAEKDDAILLQIADACALIIRYFFENRPDAEEFLNALTADNPKILRVGEKVPAGYGVVVFKQKDPPS
jgi:hypothetical protein